jgi:apolipoprotein D and lipocalin family protein
LNVSFGTVRKISQRISAEGDIPLMRSTLFALILFCSTFALASRMPVQPLEGFETSAFLGKWYEVARVENEFQIGCRGTTSTYIQGEDHSLDVENGCFVGEGSYEKHRISNGHVWIDDLTASKMKVSFVHFFVWWKPFANDYWVLDVGPKDESGHYSYAIIGHPRRKYGWVLSRTQQVDDDAYKALIEKTAQQGYDPLLFKRTEQLK